MTRLAAAESAALLRRELRRYRLLGAVFMPLMAFYLCVENPPARRHLASAFAALLVPAAVLGVFLPAAGFAFFYLGGGVVAGTLKFRQDYAAGAIRDY